MCNLGFESNSIRFQFKFPSNSSPKLKYIFHFNMVDLCSKCPIQNLWQIYKSISMQNFTFFGGPQLFLLFLFSHTDLFNSKKDLNWKNHRESFSPRSTQLGTASAQSSGRSWPTPSASSGRYQAGTSASWTPHVSLSPSRVETVTHPTRYGTRYPPKPVPFLCNSPHCPPVKFRPRPTQRCSIQASMSCPSHPFACRLTCGALASRIATEASHHPAASVDHCHRR
jgi:hypothetical protein